MLATSTINCNYSNPRLSDGTIPEDGAKLPFQYASSTCEYQIYYPVVGSSTPAIANGFTNGEIVISLFLFWIFCFLIFSFIVKFIGLFKTK